MKKNYEKNKDKKLEYLHEYNEKNREYINERQRLYTWNNKTNWGNLFKKQFGKDF